MEDEYNTLEDTLRYTFASVVWSHKIQEKQADIYSSQYKCMEISKIAAASLTSVGIVSLIFTDQMWIKILSAIISFISVFVSAFFKSFDLQTMVSAHKNTANKLLAIRNEMQIILLKIKLQPKSVTELVEEYESLVKRLDDVYANAPNTTESAVKKARTALNITQDNNFSNIEIDTYLPEKLRRNV